MIHKEVISRIKMYPIALPPHYIAKEYKRERSRWGRLLNDVEFRILKRILG